VLVSPLVAFDIPAVIAVQMTTNDHMHHVSDLPVLASGETAQVNERPIREADLHAVLTLGAVGHQSLPCKEGREHTPVEAPSPTLGVWEANGMEVAFMSAASIQETATEGAEETCKPVRLFLLGWQDRFDRRG
jgi:hypothetical protein